MNSIRGHLIVAGAVLLAATLIAYHPFQKPQPHFEFEASGGALFQFDLSTGQAWILDTKPLKWVKLPVPK